MTPAQHYTMAEAHLQFVHDAHEQMEEDQISRYLGEGQIHAILATVPANVVQEAEPLVHEYRGEVARMSQELNSRLKATRGR